MPKQLVRTALVATSLIFTSSFAWAQEPFDQPLPVRTILVPDAATTIDRQFYGRVVAKDTVSLAFEVTGKVETLHAPEGAFLPQGTLIAALDLGPFERRVERAELTYEQSLRSLERAQSLAIKNVASQVRAEDAQTAFDLAEVELREAHAALEDAHITAPFNAQIADRIASQHVFTEPGQPIVRLHDLSELRVQFDLPERLLHKIGDFSDVRFFGVIPGRDRDVALTFREFRAETGAIGQSYVVSLAIDTDAAKSLRPGQTMQVRGEIAIASTDHIIPSTAIATAADGTHYVVKVEQSDTGLTAVHVPVSVAAPTGSTLAAQGLESGTEIVEVGAHAVTDGARLTRYLGLSRTGG